MELAAAATYCQPCLSLPVKLPYCYYHLLIQTVIYFFHFSFSFPWYRGIELLAAGSLPFL